jgi:hypothetical protein
MPRHESEGPVQEDRHLAHSPYDSVARGDSSPDDLSVTQPHEPLPAAIIIPGEGPGTAPPPVQVPEAIIIPAGDGPGTDPPPKQ